MAETVRERMVRQYAYAVYHDGTRTFSSISETYHEDIKKYAAANFSDAIINDALAKGFITQQEYDETMAYKYPSTEPTEPEPTE